jgi:hypothetical protein
MDIAGASGEGALQKAIHEVDDRIVGRGPASDLRLVFACRQHLTSSEGLAPQ